MSNRDQLRSIHADLIRKHGWSGTQATQWIAGSLGRSDQTVWNWLSKSNKPIPDHMLELLKTKL